MRKEKKKPKVRELYSKRVYYRSESIGTLITLQIMLIHLNENVLERREQKKKRKARTNISNKLIVILTNMSNKQTAKNKRKSF